MDEWVKRFEKAHADYARGVHAASAGGKPPQADALLRFLWLTLNAADRKFLRDLRISSD